MPSRLSFHHRFSRGAAPEESSKTLAEPKKRHSHSGRFSFYRRFSSRVEAAPKAEPAETDTTTTATSPPKPAPKLTLHHLPTELLLSVLSSLSVKDHSAIVLTSRNLHQRLNPELWQRGLTQNSASSPLGATLLQRASQCGWDRTLRVLLDTYRVSPNLSHGENLTALHWTCNHVHYRCTSLLLSRGASIEGNPNSVSTPLHYAARAGNSAVGIITLLISAGANIDAADHKETKTALHIAALGGYSGVVSTLLDHGAKIDVRDAQGFQPLHYAAYHGFVRIVKLLLDAGADVDARGADTPDTDTPLAWALGRQHSSVVRELMAAGADPRKCQRAVESARGICRVLVSKYIKPLNAVKLGGGGGGGGRTKPPLPHRPLLHSAVQTRNVGAARSLCLHNRSVDLEEIHDGRTALGLAASLGYAEMVELLLDFGASAEARDGDGRTAAEVAGANGHKAVEYMLVRWRDIEWAALRTRQNT
jgi:ankyrin repeat protein